MRKLLTAKSFEDGQTIRRPISVNNYKHWDIRNDSSNVSAILHPENYYYSSEKSCNVENTQGVIKKRCHRGNICYCTEQRIKPKLLQRPNSCINSSESCLEKDNLSRHTLIPCNNGTTCFICNDEDVGDIESNRLHKLVKTKLVGESLYEEKSEFDKKLQFTEQRQNYENFSEHLDQNRSDWEGSQTRKDKMQSVDPFIKDKDLNGQTFNRTEQMDSEEFNQFRKDHYFETHSTENLLQPVADHVCVHKFTLDDRHLPQPTNYDGFGKSRCALCGKPMNMETKSTKDGRSTSEFKSQDSRPPSMNASRSSQSFAKYYKFGLAPKFINVGDKNSRMEVVLSDKDIELFEEYKKKLKNIQYNGNTYALRQQRMKS